MFDYWADLEYLSDGGYHDNQDPDASRKKRKLEDGQKSTSSTSKRKRPGVQPTSQQSSEPVIWMSLSERESAAALTPLSNFGKLKAIGLMADWQSRKDDRGDLASFPEGDFQLKDSHQDVSDEEEVEGEGFDLGNLSEVASLLSGENIEELQQMMEKQGLDPAVIQEVMKDMREGREREADDDDMEEDGDDEEDDEQMQADEAEFKEHGKVSTNPTPGKSQKGDQLHRAEAGASGTRHHLPNGTSAHGAKRKVPADDEDDVEAQTHDAPPRPARKKSRAGNGMSALVTEPSHRQTRSSRRRR